MHYGFPRYYAHLKLTYFAMMRDATKSKSNLKRIKSNLIDLYKSNIIRNGLSTSTRRPSDCRLNSNSSQSQITLTDYNPRSKQPGIFLATQDKNKVKSKHFLE